MGMLAVSALRQRVAAAVEALILPSPWKESPYPFELFPQDPGRFGHLAFAVGTPTTDFEAIEGGHRRLQEGALAGTDVVVRWTFALKVDAPTVSYDAALDAEALLVKAVMAASKVDLHLRVERCSRRGAGDGSWLLCETAFAGSHRYALS